MGTIGTTARGLAGAGALVLGLSCGGPTGTGTAGGPSAEFARVKAARADLVAARQALARVQAAAQGDPTEGQDLQRAQSAFDAAYARDQRVLAAFLTVALNQRPDSQETRDALALYADGAVENARIILARGGEAGRAIEALEGAERPFRILGLPVPNELAETLEQARRAQSSSPPPTPTVSTGGNAPPAARSHRRSSRTRPARVRR